MFKFLRSVLSYSINMFSFWSTKVDGKALELKEKSEQEINIPLLRSEFEEKANDQLDKQYQAIVDITKSIKLTSNQINTDRDKLQLTAKLINKTNDQLLTINEDGEVDKVTKINKQFSLQHLRLEAKGLLSDVKFNEKFVGEQNQVLEKMVINYQEKRLTAKTVLNELKRLESRNNLAISQYSIETIELGLSNYTLNDIVRIVEGKEADIEARQFADAITMREGGKTMTDIQVNELNNENLEDDLDQFLLDVKQGVNIPNKKVQVLENINIESSRI